jgi:hypothetical protein
MIKISTRLDGRETWLSIRGAAELCGVSPCTFRAWLKRGVHSYSRGIKVKPRFVRLGGRIFTSPEWLNDFICHLNDAPNDQSLIDDSRAVRADAALAATNW